MTRPEEYVRLYSSWEISPYSSPTSKPIYNQLVDLYQQMSPEERQQTSELLIQRHLKHQENL